MASCVVFIWQSKLFSKVHCCYFLRQMSQFYFWVSGAMGRCLLRRVPAQTCSEVRSLILHGQNSKELIFQGTTVVRVISLPRWECEFWCNRICMRSYYEDFRFITWRISPFAIFSYDSVIFMLLHITCYHYIKTVCRPHVSSRETNCTNHYRAQKPWFRSYLEMISLGFFRTFRQENRATW